MNKYKDKKPENNKVCLIKHKNFELGYNIGIFGTECGTKIFDTDSGFYEVKHFVDLEWEYLDNIINKPSTTTNEKPETCSCNKTAENCTCF